MIKTVLLVALLAIFSLCYAQNTLLGIHSPPMTDAGFNEIDQLYAPGKRGYVVEVFYSTDFDWIPGQIAAVQLAMRRGYTPVVRFDFARPDGSRWQDDSDAIGATIPFNGGDEYCIKRVGGPSRVVGDSKRNDKGSHLRCYLKYIEEFVSNCQGVKHWIIGNEMNIQLESKGFPGGKIDETHYATVYREARNLIRKISGHQQDIVYIGATAPGANTPPRNADGDRYLNNILSNLNKQRASYDGVSVHAYGGWPYGDPSSIKLFDQTYKATMKVISDRSSEGTIKNPAVIISEFSSHSDAQRVSGSAEFLRQAVESVSKFNASSKNRLKISGLVWFSWNIPGFESESLSKLPPVMKAFKETSARF